MLKSSPRKYFAGFPHPSDPVSRDEDEDDLGTETLHCKVAERIKLCQASTHDKNSRAPDPNLTKLSPTTQCNILNNNYHQVSPKDTEKGMKSPVNYNSNKNKYHPQLMYITGTELVKSIDSSCSTRVIEHLVDPIQQESRRREMETILSNSAADHQQVQKEQEQQQVVCVGVNEDKVREFAIETERLQSRLEHLRAQNDVLTLNLNDTKGHADHLTVLLGKYESNNIALQMTLGYR